MAGGGRPSSRTGQGVNGSVRMHGQGGREMSGEARAKNQMETTGEANVQQAVPFFMVGDIGASMRFYVEGLGFRKTREWINEGKLEWCWLEIGGAALMLQEYREDSEGGRTPRGKAGEGVSVCFQCKDALAI